MGLDVRGREENRLTSHPHVVLTPMDISDRSPTSSSICTIKHKDDGLPRQRCIIRVELNSGWEIFQYIERNRNASSVPIWETVDLTAVWTMLNEPLREDRE
jgi:hypothetical protein